VRANKHEPSEILRKEGESEMEAMQANDRNATLAIGESGHKTKRNA